MINGNQLGCYFHPFNPPTLISEFSPASYKEFYPRPSNAASPLLWVLDKLLQADSRRGLFKRKGGMAKFSSWISKTVSGQMAVEIKADQQPGNRSTRSVVESAVIFPVDELR